MCGSQTDNIASGNKLRKANTSESENRNSSRNPRKSSRPLRLRLYVYLPFMCQGLQDWALMYRMLLRRRLTRERSNLVDPELSGGWMIYAQNTTNP